MNKMEGQRKEMSQAAGGCTPSKQESKPKKEDTGSRKQKFQTKEREREFLKWWWMVFHTDSNAADNDQTRME